MERTQRRALDKHLSIPRDRENPVKVLGGMVIRRDDHSCRKPESPTKLLQQPLEASSKHLSR
jgi:hypothetical protein